MNGQETPWTPGMEAAPAADGVMEAGHPAWTPPLGDPQATQPSAETLQALAMPLAPVRATPAQGSGNAAAGVGTLRAILLGNSASADQPARLAAIERRLDELAAQLEGAQAGAQAAARGGDVTLASLANLQQQVADLRQRAETVPLPREHAPAADELADLWRQLEELRRGQVHQAGAFMEELRQTEARCQLRQRRARSATRMELAALRRRVYAPGTLWRAPAAPVARQPVHAIPLARAAYAGGRPATAQGAAAQLARHGGQRAAPETGAEAWGDVWRTLVAFLAAVWAMIALLGRELGEDLKDAWIGLGETLRRG